MTKIRSFLFIPGDSEKKLGKAASSGADALILDLEDSVIAANKLLARDLVCRFLGDHPTTERNYKILVRINPLDTPLALTDLAAIVASAPDGLMLPKANGPEDALKLSHYLDALEVQGGVAPGSIKILPVATETAISPFHLGEYPRAGLARLLGITWGAEDLAAAIGASTNTDSTGEWALTYRLVRSLCLLAARAAGVQAIDTLYVNFHDDAGLRASSRASRAEGFTGRVAIHPAQIVGINESYMPSAEEVAHAHRVIAAFDATPGAAAIGLDGRMLDIPHLKQAQGVIAQAADYAN